ncbi:MAG: 30S ribosomal protein S16 [Flavobacteriaceae bacterium]|nr:30S ribosomal protein S16 [Flavobacteriaceae bacterium]
MLAIRLQRRGRKGHAQFRVIVQDSRFSPKSGKVVENLGSYDPHTKEATLDVDRAKEFLKNGAQPSDRVARILKAEKVSLPKWVSIEKNQKRETRNPEKLRKNQTDEPKAEEDTAALTDEEATEAPSEAAAENTAEAKEEATDDAKAEKKEEKASDTEESADDAKEDK